MLLSFLGIELFLNKDCAYEENESTAVLTRMRLRFKKNIYVKYKSRYTCLIVTGVSIDLTTYRSIIFMKSRSYALNGECFETERPVKIKLLVERETRYVLYCKTIIRKIAL